MLGTTALKFCNLTIVPHLIFIFQKVVSSNFWWLHQLKKKSILKLNGFKMCCFFFFPFGNAIEFQTPCISSLKLVQNLTGSFWSLFGPSLVFLLISFVCTYFFENLLSLLGVSPRVALGEFLMGPRLDLCRLNSDRYARIYTNNGDRYGVISVK